MGFALSYEETLQTICCCVCGVQFAFPGDLVKRRREDHKLFFCPNGHEQHFRGETEAEKLKKELEREKQRREMAEREAAMEAKRANRNEAELGRVKKRVHNGVCPCCNRTFQNLARHMATKHPDHKDKA